MSSSTRYSQAWATVKLMKPGPATSTLATRSESGRWRTSASATSSRPSSGRASSTAARTRRASSSSIIGPGSGPAGQPPDRRHELDRVERLVDVRSHAQLLPLAPVLILGPGREEDQRDVSGGLVGLEPSGHVPAGHPWHHHVEEDHVGVDLGGLGDGVLPTRGGLDLEALQPQVDLDEPKDHRVVVGHQDPYARVAPQVRRIIATGTARPVATINPSGPRSSGDRALVSGTRGAGSNPAGGTENMGTVRALSTLPLSS